MKKIMQTRLEIAGDCMSASVATILGLELDQVPYFWDGCDIEAGSDEENGIIFHANLKRFLAKYDLAPLSLGLGTGDHTEWVVGISRILGDTPLLVNGLSPRRYMHNVIWKNGELWHDPHPAGGGVIPANVTFLIPKFNSRCVSPLLKESFLEGYRMAQEVDENHKTAQQVWQSDEEAWANSDMEEKLITNPPVITEEHMCEAAKFGADYPDGTLSDATLKAIMLIPFK